MLILIIFCCRRIRRRRNHEVPQGATCSICLTGIRDIQQFGRLPKCQHVFCVECITKWAEINNRCPLCKSRFNIIEKAKWSRTGKEISAGSVLIENKDIQG